MSLAPLDWTVVALFVAAILALGFSARLRDSSMLQFLAAGRALSLPAFVATLVSTWYGGILGVAESVSYFGVGAWLLIGVPYYAFALVYALAFARRVRQAEQISIPERLALRWGRGTGLVGGGLLFLLAMPAAHALMLGTLASLATGWDLPVGIAVASLVASLFLYKGGLLADVRVSLLAFVAMYVGFGAIAGWCLAHYPPMETWTRLTPQLRDWTGGGGGLQVLSFFILGAWTLVDPGFHQRVASAATPRVGQAGVAVSTLFWLLFDLLSISTALYALALSPAAGNPLEIYPRFGSAVLPPGLRGLFFCGMLGTIVTAMTAYTLVAGASFGREIVARLRPAMSEETVKFWTRLGMALATLAAIGMAWSVQSVVALWYAWGGAVTGSLLLPVSLSYLAPRTKVRPAWAVASMLAAFGVSAAWLAHSLRGGNPFQQIAWVRTAQGEWRLTMPPLPEGVDAVVFGLGTLLPALVISALVLGLGALVGGYTRDDRRPDSDD